ncbi:MAG: hypothetical protein D6707_04745 [Bacteroidetes bacterium]|nr:MAG: hypothetical protein D6707_04745 [Bacteroidota bacterium]
MKTILTIFTFFVLLLSYLAGPPPFFVTSLSVEKFSKEDKKKYNLADYYFQEEKYKKAIPIYKELVEKYPDDLFFKYRLGICYLYNPTEREKAVDYLEEVYEKAPDFTEVKFYLGRAYHLNYKFSDAESLFMSFIADGAINKDEIALAQKYIRYCQNGQKIMQYVPEHQIENLKPPVNTEWYEYKPLVSHDKSQIIFTYRGVRSTGGLQNKKNKPDSKHGSYFEDIFVAHNVNGQWSEPQSIGDNINTKYHDAAVAYSIDGQRLFIYKDALKLNADIYLSVFDGEKWSKPKKLEGEVNSEYWEGSACLAADGRTLYFSSDRPGGFGGRDIYVCELLPDGTWGNVRNLGPTINTPDNEDAPFIHADGETLYFSSDGHESMGGYDVFYSVKEGAGWSFPENMGYPISSPEDDRFYYVLPDGKTGYFSSEMPGGYGNHDIYSIIPGSSEELPKLILVNSTIYLDSLPHGADIKLFDPANGNVLGIFNADNKTGSLTMVLNRDKEYRLKIEIPDEDVDPYIEYLSTKDLNTFVDVQHDFYLFSNPYIEENGKPEPEQQFKDVVEQRIQEEITKNNEFYASVLNLYGEKVVKDVKYTIEVPVSPDIDSKKLKELGIPIKRSVYKKNTYVIGSFDKLSDLENYRKQIEAEFPELRKNKVIVMDHAKRKDLKIYYHKLYDKSDEILAATEMAKELNESPDKYASTVKEEDKELFVEIESDTFLNRAERTTTVSEPSLQQIVENQAQDTVSGTEEEAAETVVKKEETNSETLAQTSEKQKPVEEKEELPGPEDIIALNQPCSGEFIDFSFFVGKDLNDTAVYNKLIQTGGSYCTEGLRFEVQIGAYRFPWNFKYPHLRQFGTAVVRDYPDGITRFTMGKFDQLKEAEKLRQKIIKAGQWDAWITPFYNDKRMLMQELIAVNFYGKRIN